MSRPGVLEVRVLPLHRVLTTFSMGEIKTALAAFAASQAEPLDVEYAADRLYGLGLNDACFGVVLAEGEYLRGLLVFMVCESLLSPVLEASELVWFVEAGHRTPRVAHEMLTAFEQQARDMGCSRLRVATPVSSERVGIIYRRKGFSSAGTQYRKDL